MRPTAGRLVGYARVSTADQNPGLQIDALQAACCAQVFTDRGASGATANRPQLQAAISALQPGDVLVVWKLDRLGRSLRELLLLLDGLRAQGVAFASLTEGIDTSTAAGRMLTHLIGTLAEFERELLRERTAAGLAAARARGVRLGRRRALSREQVAHAAELVAAGRPRVEVARLLGVSDSTLYRALGAVDF